MIDTGFEIRSDVLTGGETADVLARLTGIPRSRAGARHLMSTVEFHECTVTRGGIVAMRPLLVHASSNSTSAAPRRVLHIEYSAGFDLGSDLELQVA